eukprot:TRINITY_DN747_c0_g2_i1.p1 TRINITY_DN747_c0_g2~~TRINITY_DN747_c0_g2_i1.p1  ORF type:complete len:309 (+),score=41.81 TRINITY_DN747_c0_g2_i1:145-1071(+)
MRVALVLLSFIVLASAAEPLSFGDFPRCINDTMLLIPLVERTVKDVQSGDVREVMHDAEALFALFQVLVVDCRDVFKTEATSVPMKQFIDEGISSQPTIRQLMDQIPPEDSELPDSDINVGNHTKCHNATIFLRLLIRQAAKDFRTGNYTQFWAHVRGIGIALRLVAKYCWHCGQDAPLNLENRTKCQNDTLLLRALVRQAVRNLVHLNFGTFARHVKAISWTLRQIAHDCRNRTIEAPPAVRKECSTDLERIREDLIHILQAYRDGDIDGVQALLQDVRDTTNLLPAHCSCTLKKVRRNGRTHLTCV